MAGERVLIVEDDRSIAELVRDYLDRDGFSTRIVSTGSAALGVFETYDPQLLLLDIMLPGLDGQEICRAVRARSDIPIVMLSARKEDADKILSLGLGADDYLTKPFSPGELSARIKAHLRRYLGTHRPGTPAATAGARIRYGELEIDLDGRIVRLAGSPIDLAQKEFDVLAFFAGHPGQVFSREQLFDRLWGENRFGEIKTVTVHIQRLRRKLGEDPDNPRYIKTVWGVGYRFDA